MNYWLVKQEPEDYPFSQLVKDKATAWTGVRNYQARNNLRGMKAGDLVFYYHSGKEKRIVGLAEVKKASYPDPTADEGDWTSVDLIPIRPAKIPLTLAAIKSEPVLKNLALVRQSRLSVMPVPIVEAKILLQTMEGSPPCEPI